MLESVNRRFLANRNLRRDDDLILESVLDVAEIIPGSDEEIDDVVDPDSVPDDVYKKIDDALESYVSKTDYDDTDVEGLVDDDVGESDEDVEKIDTIITEAAGAWLDCEDIGHPDTSRRNGCTDLKQPYFSPTGSVLDGGGDSMV